MLAPVVLTSLFLLQAITEANSRLAHLKNLAATLLPQQSMLSSFASMVKGSGRMSATELEGSVITAEAGLLSSMLLLTEESIMAFVKVRLDTSRAIQLLHCRLTRAHLHGCCQAGLSIRSSWKLYEACDKSLAGGVSGLDPDLAPQVQNDPAHGNIPCTTPTSRASTSKADAGILSGGAASETDSAVVSGVLFGMGSFNVILSCMPPIVLKIVSVLGFPCDRYAAAPADLNCDVAHAVVRLRSGSGAWRSCGCAFARRASAARLLGSCCWLCT